VELQSYKLISIIIEEHVSEYTTFMATFQNDHLKLRALAEIIINSKTATILSFYSYGYL
jgi:flagellar basal body P-ring protein FlgI